MYAFLFYPVYIFDIVTCRPTLDLVFLFFFIFTITTTIIVIITITFIIIINFITITVVVVVVVILVMRTIAAKRAIMMKLQRVTLKADSRSLC